MSYDRSKVFGLCPLCKKRNKRKDREMCSICKTNTTARELIRGVKDNRSTGPRNPLAEQRIALYTARAAAGLPLFGD